MPKGQSKNGQSRETGNIGYTRRRQINQKHNTLCIGHHYAQANTNYVNKTWAFIQTLIDKSWVTKRRGMIMSEWLLLTAKWAIHQLYHGENKLHVDEMITLMMSTTY